MSNRPGTSKSGSSRRGADVSNTNHGFDVEQQFILRLPPAPSSRLASEIEAGHSLKDRLAFSFNQDMRHISVRYGIKTYPGKLVDLPCVIESLKTTDKKTFYKTGDICQMLVCREEDDEEEEKRKQAEQDLSPRKREKMAERQFIYNHGITPPLKNVRKKRFRKTMKKKFLDMPEIEKEVKRLLRVDLEAREVKWEVVFEDEPQSQHPQPQQQTTTTTTTTAAAQQPRAAHKEEPAAAVAAPKSTAAAAGGEEGGGAVTKSGGKDVTAKTSEIFGYLSSDEEEDTPEGAATAHSRQLGSTLDTGMSVTMETADDSEEGGGGSILERACRLTLTEEDLRPFAADPEAQEAASQHGTGDCSPNASLMPPFVDSLQGEDYDGGGSAYVSSDTEARLQNRLVKLTTRIERLKAFINVRESQMPSLDHEKFRERLQQDIDNYNDQLSVTRREFEILSGQLEALAAGRST